MHKLKRLKKDVQGVHQGLLAIPDFCAQVHWKCFKGFINFRQLPKDIVTVYKKGGSLRIDYHVDDLQQVRA